VEHVDMPTKFRCPNCGVKVKAPENASTHHGKCPNCENPIELPEDPEQKRETPIDEDNWKHVPAKTKAANRYPDDDDDNEDDDADRRFRYPEKKKPKRKTIPIPIWILPVAGILCLVGIGVVGLLMFADEFLSGGPPPRGYTKINKAGIRIFLYGNVRGSNVIANGSPNPNHHVVSSSMMPFGWHDHSCDMSALRSPGYRPAPATPGAARAAYKEMMFGSRLMWYEVLSEEEIVMGGQPAVKMVIKETSPFERRLEHLQDKDRINDAMEKEQARREKEAKTQVFLYVTNGDWQYGITITNSGPDFDPEKLQTIIDSVKFK
jgi:hypothetical protein